MIRGNPQGGNGSPPGNGSAGGGASCGPSGNRNQSPPGSAGQGPAYGMMGNSGQGAGGMSGNFSQGPVQGPQGGFQGYGPQSGAGGYGPSGNSGGASGPAGYSGGAWGPAGNYGPGVRNGFPAQGISGGSFGGNSAGGAFVQGAAHAADLSQRAVGAGVRAAHKAVSLKILALIAVALIAIASILYVVFIKSGTPEDTIEKMEHALNNLDQDELLECFDNQIQDLYSGALSVGGELAGIDLGGLSDLASGLGGFMSAAGLTPEFDLQIVNIEYTDEDNCVAEVNFIITYQGQTQSETQILPMTKEGREWVVSASAL